MKGSLRALGFFGLLIGVPLLMGGIFVFVMAAWVIDPTIAGGGQNEGWASMGFLGACVGALLCLAAGFLCSRD